MFFFFKATPLVSKRAVETVEGGVFGSISGAPIKGMVKNLSQDFCLLGPEQASPAKVSQPKKSGF